MLEGMWKIEFKSDERKTCIDYMGGKQMIIKDGKIAEHQCLELTHIGERREIKFSCKGGITDPTKCVDEGTKRREGRRDGELLVDTVDERRWSHFKVEEIRTTFTNNGRKRGFQNKEVIAKNEFLQCWSNLVD